MSSHNSVPTNGASEEQTPDDASVGQGTRRRARNPMLWIAAATLLTVLSGVAVVGWVVFDVGGRDEPCGPKPVSDKTNVVDPVAKPEQGGVELIESGSVYIEGRGGRVSYGSVLENTTDVVAFDVTVTTNIYYDDRLVASEFAVEGDNETSIPFILPGGSFGSGGGANQLEQAGEDPDLYSIEVEVEVGQWWPVENDVYEFPSIHGASADSTITIGLFAIAYTADSDHCETVEGAAASAVFRSDDGNIIGGTAGAQSHEVVDPKNYTPDDPRGAYPPGVSKQLWIFGGDSLIDSPGTGFDVEPAEVEVFPHPASVDDF